MNLLMKTDAISKIEKELQDIKNNTSLYATINTKDDAEKVANTMIIVKKLGKEVEEKRKNLVKPYNDYIKGFNAEIKELTTLVEDIHSDLKKPYQSWMDEQERKEKARLEAERAEAIAQAQKEAEEKQAEILLIAEKTGNQDLFEQAEMMKQEANKSIMAIANQELDAKICNKHGAGTMYQVDKWTAEVIDVFELLKHIVTAKELGSDLSYMIDVSKSGLNTYAKTIKKETYINGLKIYNDNSLRGR